MHTSLQTAAYPVALGSSALGASLPLVYKPARPWDMVSLEARKPFLKVALLSKSSFFAK